MSSVGDNSDPKSKGTSKKEENDEEIIVVIQCEAKFNKKTNKYLGF